MSEITFVVLVSISCLCGKIRRVRWLLLMPLFFVLRDPTFEADRNCVIVNFGHSVRASCLWASEETQSVRRLQGVQMFERTLRNVSARYTSSNA